MKNWVYWTFLFALVLTVVFFWGCDVAEDTENPVNMSGTVNGNGANGTNTDVDLERVDIGGAGNYPIDLADILDEAEDILDEARKNQAQREVKPPIIVRHAANGEVGINPRLWIEFNEPINKVEITLKTEAGDAVEIFIIFRNETTIELMRLGEGEDFHLKPLETYIIKGWVFDDVGNKAPVDITFRTDEG